MLKHELDADKNMIKSLRKPSLFLLFSLNVLTPAQSLAQDAPVYIPNLQELCSCEWIAVADYRGFTAAKVVTPSNPPVAMFKIKKQLRGLRYSSRSYLPVIYEFDKTRS